MLTTSTSVCCVSSTCTSLWLKLPYNRMYILANAHQYMEEHQTYNAHKSRIVSSYTLYLPLILNVITAEFRSQPKRCLFWILFLQTTQGFNFSHMVNHFQINCCILCGQRTANEVTLQPCFGCNSELSLKFTGKKTNTSIHLRDETFGFLLTDIVG